MQSTSFDSIWIAIQVSVCFIAALSIGTLLQFVAQATLLAGVMHLSKEADMEEPCSIV